MKPTSAFLPRPYDPSRSISPPLQVGDFLVRVQPSQPYPDDVEAIRAFVRDGHPANFEAEVVFANRRSFPRVIEIRAVGVGDVGR